MIITSIVGDGKEHILNTLVTTTYNGGGGANHELIAIDALPYEHTSKPFYLYKDANFK
jgi:hypothetical protein